MMCQREAEEQTAMAIMNEAVCNAPVLKMSDVSNATCQLVIGVDTN